MLELVTPTVEEPVELVDIFSIDGRAYQMPIEVPPNVGLKYLKILRQRGDVVANGWALEEMLGTEAYDALANFKGLTTEHLEQLQEIVGKHVLGSMEEPGQVAAGKAGSRPAPPRSPGRSTTRRTSKRTS